MFRTAACLRPIGLERWGEGEAPAGRLVPFSGEVGAHFLEITLCKFFPEQTAPLRGEGSSRLQA